MADDVSVETYARFLLAPWGGETRFIEAHLDQRLMSVAVTDVFSDGLSAVYTFFDPDLSERGPGTYAVLTQLREAARLGLAYVYLGYWIAESRKMAYKDAFRPLEAWDGHRWRRFDRAQPIAF
jgi:arginine-tRNA-protein transferase